MDDVGIVVPPTGLEVAAETHLSPAAGTRTGPIRLAPGSESADGTERWVVSRYDDVVAALSDPRMSAARVYPTDCALARMIDEGHTATDLTATRILSRTMIAADPPEHTRLRRQVVRTFSAKRMEALRPRVQQIADELLDAIVGRDEVDIVKTFGFPLPVRVLGELLGVPEDIGRQLLPPEDEIDRPMIPMAIAHAASIEWVEARRREPTDDLLSTLVAAHEQGELSYDELVAMPLILLIAGHLTTIHLIGNGILRLLQHPAEFADLRRDPTAVPAAVDEVLRHTGPATFVSRYALADIEIGGTTIPANSYVRVLLRAANHDPDRFADPDRFHIRRQGDADELAFGYGVHFCLGARLAKLEGEVAIGTLIRRFPDLALAGPAALEEIEEGVIGVERLPVRLGRPR